MTADVPRHAARKFYGRRHGKALRAAQAQRVAEALPRLAIPGAAREGDPGRAPVDPVALFGDDRPVWLEIGFGGGEHLVHQAASHPEVGFLGAEPFVNGVAAFLAKAEAAGLGNVRLHPADARDLIDMLPDAALERVFLLYPDPWPKARHADRRFMSATNLAALARVMAPGAELRLATDIPDYVRHALEAVEATPRFAEEPRDRAAPWPDWIRTRYEAKALREGRTPAYLSFRRQP